MNGMNAPENTDTFIQACLRLSVDEKYKEFLEAGDFEKIKNFLKKNDDISIVLGYAKNSEILDFLLLNGKNVYAPYACSGLINRYSVYLSEADDKDFIHKKYLSMAEVLIKNGVDKLKKMGKDLSDDCQEVVGAVLCAPATEVV